MGKGEIEIEIKESAGMKGNVQKESSSNTWSTDMRRCGEGWRHSWRQQTLKVEFLPERQQNESRTRSIRASEHQIIRGTAQVRCCGDKARLRVSAERVKVSVEG